MNQTSLTDPGRLYITDAYLFSFNATVTAVRPWERGCAVVLDRTAFFPEGGGQLSDLGTLDGARVTDVRDTDEGIVHIVDAPPERFDVCACVHGQIDAEVRLDAMQCHTAEHILSGVIYREFGLSNVGFHLGRDEMTVDISGPLTREQLAYVEDLANTAVRACLPVRAYFPSEEELATLSYRSKLDLLGGVRLVTVEGVDTCACCAPHVRSTGEVGLIKIVAAESHKGGMHLSVVAGARALRAYREVHDELHRTAARMSVHVTEADAAVERLQDELKRVNLLYKSALTDKLLSDAAHMTFDEPNTVVLLDRLPTECVRRFLGAAVLRTEGTITVLMKREGGFDFITASRTVDLATCVRAMTAALNGRGGGSATMVQGTFLADEPTVRAYFKTTNFAKND